MTPFSKKVIALIQKIPRGKVETYGEIAALAGKPGSARAVGWILHSCAKSHKLPWQRVINSKGKISFDRSSSEFARQFRLLTLEDVDVSPYGEVSLSTYKWKKRPRQKTSW